MIDRRTTLAGIGSLLVPAAPAFAQARLLSAREVFAAIRQASGQKWNPNATDDRIIFGDRGVPVTGIATCFLASVDVLRRARAEGLNYIIPHEATFYERYDDLAQSALLDSDPVLRAKTRFLSDNGMVIQRMHIQAHNRPGDAINVGLIRKLGWESYRTAGRPGVISVKLPPASAGEVGRFIARRLGRRTLRMFGDPARTISTISMTVGMPGENVQIQQLESGADAVFLGEVREAEVMGYAQDIAASRQVTVFMVGHTCEDPGMGVLAEWLQTVFPKLPVKWLPLTDPYSNPD